MTALAILVATQAALVAVLIRDDIVATIRTRRAPADGIRPATPFRLYRSGDGAT